jgi:hypothetical protein
VRRCYRLGPMDFASSVVALPSLARSAARSPAESGAAGRRAGLDGSMPTRLPVRAATGGALDPIEAKSAVVSSRQGHRVAQVSGLVRSRCHLRWSVPR